MTSLYRLKRAIAVNFLRADLSHETPIVANLPQLLPSSIRSFFLLLQYDEMREERPLLSKSYSPYSQPPVCMWDDIDRKEKGVIH